MPNQKYALERNGPKRLEISWGGFWKDFTAKVDGQVVGTWTKDELNSGKEVTLPDGSTLKVHLRRVGLGQELQLLRNGQPLPGSGSDPVQLVKTAAGVVYFLAAAQAVLGVVAIVGDVQLLIDLGMGIPSIIIGVILGVLGFFTMQRSRIALGLAMALYTLGFVLTIATGVEAGRAPTGGIIVYIIFISAMFRGFKAMGTLQAQPQSS